MSTIKPATLDNSAIAPAVLPSPSRRQFLIGSAGIAAAASLSAATMAATSEPATASTPSNTKEEDYEDRCGGDEVLDLGRGAGWQITDVT